MKSMCDRDYDEVVEFVMENIEKSLFIYSNMQMKGSIVRFKKCDDKILGMYVIVFEKYITFLFGNIDNKYILEIIEDSLNYPYIEGTVVGLSFDILNQYYIVKNFDIKNYIATLKGSAVHKYIKYDNVNLLNLENEKEALEYVKVINEIVEFEPTSLEILKKNNSNTKIYVYKIADKIVGGATLTAISDLTAVVTSVFVSDGYRCQKIATKLMNTLLQSNLKEDRITFIFFNNPYAQDLYLKLGFEIKNKMNIFLRK